MNWRGQRRAVRRGSKRFQNNCIPNESRDACPSSSSVYFNIVETHDNNIIVNLFPSDVNECMLGLHNCHPNATCSNTDGGFECFCNIGFEGDGISCNSESLTMSFDISSTVCSYSVAIKYICTPTYVLDYGHII